MKQALLIGLALMHGGAAEAQGVKENVMMHVRANFVPSTTGCSLFSFVAAPPSSQPEASATLCAIGGDRLAPAWWALSSGHFRPLRG